MPNTQDVILIEYNRKYLADIVALFNHTIQKVNRQDYSQAEINEWIQPNPDLDSWHDNLSKSYCVLAFKADCLVGFGNITADGYLDLLFVAHSVIRSGIGRLIFNRLEQYARLKK
ncbi:GNAT family N-acetyltransferase [Lapidilactobacillus mulanensis]|uniref:GNAT family N-acetyltransferase n=1 Tax=Lapidilactobacillus mulanensis TaxID=2485999 RepID=A0ABW4DJJ7_9LACO|nr:GNAT family N-acetyltransferase [Lapidilactobacillus mulanensis]